MFSITLNVIHSNKFGKMLILCSPLFNLTGNTSSNVSNPQYLLNLDHEGFFNNQIYKSTRLKIFQEKKFLANIEWCQCALQKNF